MASPEAVPGDVRDVIDTDESDSAIDAKLDDAAFDIDRSVSESLETEHRVKLEAHLAALYIRLSTDRSVESGSGASTRIDFDGSEIEWLQRRVERLDPSESLLDDTEFWAVTRTG